MYYFKSVIFNYALAYSSVRFPIETYTNVTKKLFLLVSGKEIQNFLLSLVSENIQR